MTYVMSDIHGEYGKFIKMLDKVSFSTNDRLYILGDIIDRGDNPIELLEYAASCSNIYPILGNHELMALHLLDVVFGDNLDNMSAQTMSAILNWRFNGGSTTIKSFAALSRSDRNHLIDYIKSFPLYLECDVAERHYILVHSGIGNFNKDRPLSSYSADELTNTRHCLKTQFIDSNVFIVSGHTPTQFYSGKPEIYYENNNICIDTGASMKDGLLSCLALETHDEFYV